MHQCKHTLNLSCVCQRQDQTFYLTAGLCMSKMKTKPCTCVCLKLRLKLRLQKWSCKGRCKDQNRSAKSHLNTQTTCCYLYPTKYQYTTKRSFLSHHKKCQSTAVEIRLFTKSSIHSFIFIFIEH